MPTADLTTNGLLALLSTALYLTPLLFLVKVATPVPIPWLAVFIPWLGSFHLVLCWVAARIIARVFWDLARLLS